VIHLTGIIVLVIGLSIGVKYAIDRELISEALRISLAYGAGILLLFLSYRLRSNFNFFSAILFSGAMASLYFTTYGAYVYYQLIPSVLSFILMIALTVFTVYQAIKYNRQEIALLGFIGAYAIPFLISKNSDNATLFFAYISLINTGVVFLTIKKQWNLVSMIAQHITWVLFIGWASLRFNPSIIGIGTLYLCFFFLLFLFSAISPLVFYSKQLDQPGVYHIVLNNMSFFIGALFVYGATYNEATIAAITLFMALVAAVQAFFFSSVWRDDNAKRYIATYGFILFVACINFQWRGITVTLLWLLIAVLVFALGLYKKWSSLRMTALMLLGATLFKLVAFDSLKFTTVQKVISYLLLGVLLLVIAFFYQKFKQQLFHED
ncbi:MAG TPA: DUF2339 domain-containing protein, partial [Flavisolibacter sp.]|nr:DUF2339 domain-containing protein [Flavisolibacter sp.]